MCYNLVSATRKKLSYAMHRGADPKDIADIERQLEELERTVPPLFQVSGFAHPRLIVFSSDEPYKPQAFQWGLVPFWVKDAKGAKQISNQTLNARSESIFEKPAFRNAAKNKRCLVYIDAFYEHHHLNGNTYPFHIGMKDGSPIVVAGLWEEWVDKETGEVLRTVTLVTCPGNSIMAKIHNNPKADGPRMPVILSKEMQDYWLRPSPTADLKTEILKLAVPFDEEQLEYYPVFKILGKQALGNCPEAENKYEYAELAEVF